MKQKTGIKTIKQVLQDGTSFLEAKGSENARLEAEKLIAFGLKKERVDIYLSLEKPLTEAELQTLRKFFVERGAGRPLQHIIGEVHFRYLKLAVNEHTFIARPETELIVDLALKIINHDVHSLSLDGRGLGRGCSPKVLELGTGSGAIALAIAQEGKVKVDAVDISDKALETAKQNAESNNIGGITWSKSDWFEEVSGKYDVIVCNPPYVSLKEYKKLPVEIREHEPQQAVTDNSDGLKCLKQIIFSAPGYLNDKGILFLEIGFDQKESVKTVLEKVGFKKINFEKDLAGHTRFAIASS